MIFSRSGISVKPCTIWIALSLVINRRKSASLKCQISLCTSTSHTIHIYHVPVFFSWKECSRLVGFWFLLIIFFIFFFLKPFWVWAFGGFALLAFPVLRTLSRDTKINQNDFQWLIQVRAGWPWHNHSSHLIAAPLLAPNQIGTVTPQHFHTGSNFCWAGGISATGSYFPSPTVSFYVSKNYSCLSVPARPVHGRQGFRVAGRISERSLAGEKARWAFHKCYSANTKQG